MNGGDPDTSVPDAKALYVACAERVGRLVDRHRGELARPIDACPGWSARDLVGHLVGIADDWRTGRLDQYASPGWTEAQVAAMAELGLDDLLSRWHHLIDSLDEIEPNPVLGAPWRWLAGDALCHEADLAESLGDSPPPDDAVRFGLDSVIPRWRAVLDSAGAPPLELCPVGARRRRVGGRADDGEHVARVTVDATELWRALYGRRSRQAIEAWSWSVDPSPWLDAGLPFPFQFARDSS